METVDPAGALEDLAARPAEARAHRHALLAFALANAAGAVLHAIGYHRAIAAATGGRALLSLALAGQLPAAFLLGAALLLPLTPLRVGRVLLPVAAPAVAGALHLFFFVDRKVFAAMGMHVNGLLLDLALAQGGLRAMDVDASEWRRLAASALAVAAAEVAGYAWLARRPAFPWRAARHGWIGAAAVVVVLLATERVAYAASTVTGWGRGAATTAAPAYGVERLVRLRDWEPTPLRYPRAPLAFSADAARPNLVWIVVESWRRDALGPEVSPALWRQSRRSLTFLNHVSGGNATIAGVYSQFYGLHANAVPSLRRTREPPVLLRALRDLGYRIRVIASPDAGFADMNVTVFAGGAGELEQADGRAPHERDRSAADKAAAFLRGARRGEPFALVVLLDGTHEPYHFDPARARHVPYAEDLRTLNLDQPPDAASLRNRYLNAVAEVDAAAGTILDALEERGLGGETVTVVAGDHGEQLLEHGRISHQISLSRVETETPLLLRIPGTPPGERTDLSRHVDLPPTILGVLGALNPPSDYSVGRSLLRDPEPDHAVLVSRMQVGIRTRDGWTVEWDTGDAALDVRSGYRVMDPAYREVPAGALPWPKALTAGLEDLQRFSR